MDPHTHSCEDTPVLFAKIGILAFLFSLFVTVLVAPSITHAGIATTITRGEPAVISWYVSGVPSCSPSYSGTAYPNNTPADTIHTSWTGSVKSNTGFLSFPKALGNASAAFPQTYLFTCSGGGDSDTASITINDCAAGTAWVGGSTNACVPAHTVTIVPPTGASGGSISPTGPISVAPGGNTPPITITPPGGGYCDVTVNGVSRGVTNTFVSTNVTSDQTISARCMTASFTGPAPTCLIPDGVVVAPNQYRACYGTLNWTSNGVSNAVVTNCGGGVLTTTPPGAQSTIAYTPYPSGCFNIRDSVTGIPIATTTITASCGSGYTWNAGLNQCIPSAAPTVTVNVCNIGGTACVTNAGTKTITPTGQVEVTWSSTGATSCSVNAGPADFAVSGLSGTDNTITEPALGTVTVMAVQCTNGAGTTVQQVTVNAPPSVNAGSDINGITVPGPASPSGAGATDSSGVQTTNWTYLTGPGGASPTITNGGSFTPTFGNMTVPGAYTFECTVTDNLGGSSSDTVVVNVGPSASAPDLTAINTAPAVNQSFNNPTSITFTGTLRNDGTAVTAVGQNVWADVEIDWNQANCAIATPEATKNAGGPWTSLAVGVPQLMSANLTRANSELRNGTHCYRMVVDRGGLVTESNNGNNGGAWTSITISNLPEGSDGVDNDGDGQTDFPADSDCTSDDDDSEAPTPVNGVPGPANGVPVSSAPTTGLCSAGTPTAVSGTGPWTWTCQGSSGGTDAPGSAPVLSALQPDLTTSLPTASLPSVVQGGVITLNTNTIRNSGTGDANPHSIGGFYIDHNGDGTADYTVPIPAQTVITAPGGTYTRSVTWTVPVGAPTGANYRVSYIVDDPAAVGESNEGNNFSGWSSSFSVTPVAVGCNIGSSPGGCAFPSGSAGQNIPSASCSTGYTGSCNITCNGGTGFWGVNTDSCTPPNITQFEICDTTLTTCTSGTNSNTSPGPAHPTVPAGTQLVIRWNSSGADTCTGTGFSTGSGNPSSGGPITVTTSLVPNAQNIYSVMCTKGGTAITADTAYVHVVNDNPAPTLTPSSRTVQVGTSITLDWDTNNGDETLCTLTGGGLSGNLPGAGPAETGSRSVVIQGRTTFTLTCGTQSDVETVDVIPQNFES